MIEIKRVENNLKRKEICDKNGVEYNKDLIVIASFEKGIIKNSAIFDYSGKIYCVENDENDFDLVYGISKAVLNILDLNNVKKAFLPKKYEFLAKKLGFQEENGGYAVSLEGYFKCCNCKL